MHSSHNFFSPCCLYCFFLLFLFYPGVQRHMVKNLLARSAKKNPLVESKVVTLQKCNNLIMYYTSLIEFPAVLSHLYFYKAFYALEYKTQQPKQLAVKNSVQPPISLAPKCTYLHSHRTLPTGQTVKLLTCLLSLNLILLHHWSRVQKTIISHPVHPSVLWPSASNAFSTLLFPPLCE